MARITPIDVIKSISGKYGSGSNDYFATNKSSNRIHLAKYLNKPAGPMTEAQVRQTQLFASQQKMAAAWLRANRPSTDNGDKGTEAYQKAQRIKRQLCLSNVRQVILKYMDADGTVTLPDGSVTTAPEQSGGNSNPSGGSGNNGGNTGGNTGSGDEGGGF